MDKQINTYVLVGPKGLHYVGLHESEADTWKVALGWPDDEEIAYKKARGWYVAKAYLEWEVP